MANFNDRYNQLIADIEKNISDENQKRYVIKKVQEVSMMYMEIIDRVTRMDTSKIAELEEKQQAMQNSLSKIEETVNLIKSDIYEEEGYEFEIVCPYCNKEFVADIESELKEEIICPECNNVIELDWDDEEEGCSGCSGSDCSACAEIYQNNSTTQQEDTNNDAQNNQNSEEKNPQENNEDDM